MRSLPMSAPHAMPWGRRTEAGGCSPTASIPVSANAHHLGAELAHADDLPCNPFDLHSAVS
jgi:hypothetical protein